MVNSTNGKNYVRLYQNAMEDKQSLIVRVRELSRCLEEKQKSEVTQERMYQMKVVTFHETVDLRVTKAVMKEIMNDFYEGNTIALGHKLPELEGDKIDQIVIDKTDDFIHYKK